MAFDNVLFPVTPSGLHAKSAWLTIVVESRDGSEDRTAVWQDALRSYDIALTNMTLANFITLEGHFNARRGQERAFPLLDYYNSTATTETFGTGNGSTLTFQLTINDGDSDNAYNRKIYKPLSGTVVIKDNGTTKTEGAHYSINYTTGIVTFVSAPANTHTLTWSGTFYVPVRYGVDEIDPNLFIWSDNGQQIVQGPSIPLIETRDIN